MPLPRKRAHEDAEPLLVLAAWAPELAVLNNFLKRDRSGLRHLVRTATVGVGLVEAGVGAALALGGRPTAAILVGTAGVFAGHPWKPPHALALDEVLLNCGDAPKIAELAPPMRTHLKTDARLTASLARAGDLSRTTAVCPLAITRGPARARRLARESGASLENLEAFAVVHAAQRLAVPVASVLGVANKVGPEGGKEWRAHGADAAARACTAVMAWLQSPLCQPWLAKP
ncbi:MAG: hypothetical protein SF187_10495 [Deltaproteobacteria bacterium]|nr:hypothetical protein [Deltaproteobacteria bacterium]